MFGMLAIQNRCEPHAAPFVSGARQVQVNPPKRPRLSITMTSIGDIMPSKKATSKKPRKGRVTDHVARLLCPKRDPIPPSLATYDRIDELSRPTPTELECCVCKGVGLPKIEGSDMRICVVCRDALKDVPRAGRKALIADREHFLLHRLPFFRDWFLSPDRMGVVTDNRMTA
jgi:hypothetical protein